MMRKWASRYQLQPRSALNALTSSDPRSGALLKIETQFGIGYADLHPWVELGDQSLEEQLRSLSGQPYALAARSLELAGADAQARASGVSLLARPLPTNHFLLTNLVAAGRGEIEGAWSGGFRHLKIKLGRDLAREAEALLRLSEDLAAFKLRFDFNGSLSAESYASFMGSLPESILRAVEFVEDPCAYSSARWTQLEERVGVPLALDRWPAESITDGFSWFVFKPALQRASVIPAGVQIAATSYMDHPLGQSAAAWEASRLAACGVCGLLSQRAYEPNEYSRRLSDGPQFLSPGGTGFGFDDLLAREPWQELP